MAYAPIYYAFVRVKMNNLFIEVEGVLFRVRLDSRAKYSLIYSCTRVKWLWSGYQHEHIIALVIQHEHIIALVIQHEHIIALVIQPEFFASNGIMQASIFAINYHAY